MAIFMTRCLWLGPLVRALKWKFMGSSLLVMLQGLILLREQGSSLDGVRLNCVQYPTKGSGDGSILQSCPDGGEGLLGPLHQSLGAGSSNSREQSNGYSSSLQPRAVPQE